MAGKEKGRGVVWSFAYAREQSRDLHATRRQYIRSALCAVALAVLGMLS